MRVFRFAVACVIAACAASSAAAQESSPVVVLPWYQATAYVDKGVAPVYPAIAWAAQVEAAVTVYAAVRPDGSVGAILLPHDSPLLSVAATDAARQWRFRPATIDGRPAETRMELVFYFFRDDTPAVRSSTLELHARARECRSLLDAKRDADAESACLSLNNLAGKLPDNRRAERALAHRLAGEFLAARKRATEAIDELQMAIKLQDAVVVNQDAALAYQDAARIYAAAGDIENARRAFEDAEKSLGKFQKELRAVRHPAVVQGDTQADKQLRQEFDERCTRSIQGVLTELIQFLQGAGKTDDARAAQERLDRLTAPPRSK